MPLCHHTDANAKRYLLSGATEIHLPALVDIRPVEAREVLIPIIIDRASDGRPGDPATDTMVVNMGRS
jgi:hypothetical protein